MQIAFVGSVVLLALLLAFGSVEGRVKTKPVLPGGSAANRRNTLNDTCAPCKIGTNYLLLL
jgi:hypothetical protein